MYSHTLIIGGTGMLRKASRSLARDSKTLTSIARTQRSLRAFDSAIANVACTHCMLALDWSDPVAFVNAVAVHARATRDPDLVLAWLHDDELGPALANALAPATGRCAFFQVRGSAAANPTGHAEAFLHDHGSPATIDYHQVILGYRAGRGGSRWLHDDEIYAGVLDAIEHPRATTIVGTVEPWSSRPCGRPRMPGNQAKPATEVGGIMGMLRKSGADARP